MIKQFKGEYFFLSNFYETPVSYEGITYQNNEAAFQAQKTLDIKERMQFSNLNSSEAKQKGRRIKLRNDWEEAKEQVMYEICKAKFDQHPELMEKLLLTGNRPLEEGNHWGDRVWGTVDGVGENKLGKILMKIRSELIDDCVVPNEETLQAMEEAETSANDPNIKRYQSVEELMNDLNSEDEKV